MRSKAVRILAPQRLSRSGHHRASDQSGCGRFPDETGKIERFARRNSQRPDATFRPTRVERCARRATGSVERVVNTRGRHGWRAALRQAQQISKALQEVAERAIAIRENMARLRALRAAKEAEAGQSNAQPTESRRKRDRGDDGERLLNYKLGRRDEPNGLPRRPGCENPSQCSISHCAFLNAAAGSLPKTSQVRYTGCQPKATRLPARRI
jgi:hypothetical protein